MGTETAMCSFGALHASESIGEEQITDLVELTDLSIKLLLYNGVKEDHV